MRYIVASPEYWESIPRTRELTCGRVRFTNYQCVPPKEANVYVLKADALQAVRSGRFQLIRETHYSETTWHYQLLFGFTNSAKE